MNTTKRFSEQAPQSPPVAGHGDVATGLIGTPYDQIADRFHAIRTRLQSKEVEYLSLLLDSLAEGRTILDLGCGTGHPIATYIASRGHHVAGVDGSEAMLAIARKRLPAHRWIHALI